MHSKTYLVGLLALSFLNSTSVSAAALPPPYQERLAEQQQQQQQQQLEQQQLQQFQENLRQQEQELQQQQEFLQPSSHDSSHLFLSTLPTPAQSISEFVVREIPDPSATVDTPPPAEKLHCECEKSDDKKEQKKDKKNSLTTISPVKIAILCTIAAAIYPAALVAEQMLYNIIVGIGVLLLAVTTIVFGILPGVVKDIVSWKLAVSAYGGAILMALALRAAGSLLKLLKMDAARNELSFPPIRFKLFSFKYGYPGSDSDVSVQAPVAGPSEGADLALPARRGDIEMQDMHN